MSTTENVNGSTAGTAGALERNARAVTPWERFRRRFRRHRLAMGGLAFILLLALLGIFAPVVAGQDETKTNLSQALQAPSRDHLLGTDPSGRDVWARIIFAIRVSLSVGIMAVGISVLIAVMLGSLSGYYGRTVDMVIMRITDVVMCFPGLIIIMSVREWDFVLAARCLGVPDRRIMFVHVLPNAIAPLVVAATFGVAGAILTEAGLSFLGLGVLPPAPSWGNMLNMARSISMLERNPWFWLPPGLMILTTVLAINFIGDGLRDALDPRMSLD